MQVNAQSTSKSTSLLAEILLGFGPTILLVGLFVLLARRAQGGAGGLGALGNFGRSQARRVDPEKIRVTFDDVAGIDEAKAELTEIVDFLREPERYQRLGGRMPHGVLLFGPPGTGKTLLARGRSRARRTRPSSRLRRRSSSKRSSGWAHHACVTCSPRPRRPRRRSSSSTSSTRSGARDQGSNPFGGGNDEREQTLDQILTEMDGFESNVAVVVLGATNRPEILDQALLRPGRFDRRVGVQPPDRDGRRKILEVHTRSMPLGDDVDLEVLASTTPGMVGADLANLANEAALLATRRGHDNVQMADFTDALEKIMLGAPRGIILSAEDRERTAYHESGHALVGMLTPNADPVRKVSIIPRGMALGVTLSTPDSDRVSYSREDLEAKIDVALGGRVAEEVVYGKITTGAESDIQQLTQIARQMVGRWGMSDKLGPITLLPADGQGPLAPGRQRDLPADPVADRPGGPADGRGCPRSRHPAADRASLPARRPRPRPAPRRDARRGRRLRGRRGADENRPDARVSSPVDPQAHG